MILARTRVINSYTINFVSFENETWELADIYEINAFSFPKALLCLQPTQTIKKIYPLLQILQRKFSKIFLGCYDV
jgi:hypothetical protein